MKLLEQEASNRKLALNLLQVDLEASVSLPEGPFDVISKFFYLQRSLLPIIKDILKPGGIVVLRSFGKAKDSTIESGNPDFILNPGELLEVFAEWDILLYEEGLEESRMKDPKQDKHHAWQAVPLLKTEPPYVATGLEERAASDSRVGFPPQATTVAP